MPLPAWGWRPLPPFRIGRQGMAAGLLQWSDRAVPWVFPWALGALAFVSAYPPMSDLPFHEAMGALWVHRSDPQWTAPGLYELSLGHPQQLAPFALAVAMLLFPPIVATKTVVGLTLAAIAAATQRLLRHVGKTPWAALLASPLAVGWLFRSGFLSNLMGLALFAHGLIEIDRHAKEPTLGRGARVGVLLALGFLAHATTALALSLGLVVGALVYRRRVWVCLGPLWVLGVLFPLEAYRNQGAPTDLVRAMGAEVLWHSLKTKTKVLPELLAGGYAYPATPVAMVTGLLGLGSLLLGQRGAAPAPGPWWVRLRFGVLSGALGLAYGVLPYSVNYGAFLYGRFLAPALVAALVTLAPERAHGWLRAAALLCFGAATTALVPGFVDADAHMAMLEPLIAHVEKGSSTGVVSFGKHPPVGFAVVSLGQRVLTERGGRVLFSFTEYPSSPVQITPGKRWDRLLLRVYSEPGALRPSTDLNVLRYVLAYVSEDALRPLVVEGFRPDAHLVALSGDWLLFESNHEVRPIDAPLPEAFEKPSAETLQQRVRAILQGRPRLSTSP